MKLPALLLLFASAPLLFGQTFVTGQAARAEIGQYSFSRGDVLATRQILGGVGGLAWANGTLFVADDNRAGATPNNNRVMMFNTAQIPAPHDDLSGIAPFNSFCNLCGYPAFNVIGQTSFDAPIPDPGKPQTPPLPGRTPTQMSTPTAVATDGTILAVADTDNNRVLIYNSIPTAPGAAANVVLGQPDFTTLQPASTTATSLRGPEGVWISNGKLFVADTQNNRVLIWNHIPTSNNQPADVVLGQQNFTSANQPAPGARNPTAGANQLLNPTSVTTDPTGTHLFVSDLGFNRVLIWNEIPTSNAQPADVVIGQPDMTSTLANNTNNLCSSPGNDSTGKPIYPSECNKTLNFPRYALSDGTHLFVADGGNDRVLVFNSIPTQNGGGADVVLGQPDFYGDVVASGMATFGSTAVDNTGSVDTVQTPTSLAWDGTNLYVSDPFDRRVLVFSPIGPGDTTLGNKSILNAASRILRQEGFVTLAVPSTGSITAKDTVTITIAGTAYTYTVKDGDTLASITQGLISAINTSNNNAGDPSAFALTGSIPNTIYLSARDVNAATDATSISATTSNTNNIVAAASGNYLTGGTSATVAPGTLIEIDGTNLADNTLKANTGSTLPTVLGGVQVYIDGFPAPIMSVSPNQVISQVPFNFTDRSSSSVYVRTQHSNGQVGVTNAAPIVLVPANPGLFAQSGTEPRPAFQAMHSAGNPSDVVSVDGSVQAGDVATVTIDGKAYNYTVLASDTLTTVAQGLIAAINSGSGDPKVNATPGGAFARVVLTAKDPAGNGVTVSASVTAASGKSSAGLVLTAYNDKTCCSNSNSGLITSANPAQPGEIITVLATGLGVIQDSNGNLIDSAVAGQPYSGPTPNTAVDPVSATVNNFTGQVISAGIPTGSTGVYQVQIQLPSDLAADPNAQISIAQDAFVSNIVTIPVASNPTSSVYAVPNPLPAGTSTTTLYWAVADGTNVSVHSGSATGPVIGSGGSSGNVAVTNATDGEVLYVTDASNGNVLGTTTLQVQKTSGDVITANPNPITVPVGTIYGRTTLSWNTPDAGREEVHVNSPTGPLFSASSGGVGSATTGDWVSDKMTFYLVNAGSNKVEGSVQVGVNAVSGVITPAQNPVPVVGGTSFGQTSITWNAPAASATEIHVGGPAGPLFAAGTSTGSATTGVWVTDGLTFYLQDSTNGNATSPQNTLGTLTLHLQGGGGSTPGTPSGQTVLSLPNPVPLVSGSTYGKAVLNWSAPGASRIEVHVNSPTGPLFAAGGSTGSQSTGAWITNGMTFYLVDASSHATLATASAQLQGSTGNFLTLPNPVPVAQGSTYGQATLNWSAPGVSATEVHVDSPTGPLFAAGGSAGNQGTGVWITNGMTFYLIDASSHATLATATAQLQ